MAQTPPSPGKKKKPIPSWYYVAGAGALVAVYYLYSRSKANATAAAATPAAATGAGTSTDTGTAAGSYGNAGDLAALAPYLSQLQGAASTTGTSGVATTGTAYTPPTGETLVGSGFGTGTSETPITDASGNSYTWISSPAVEAGLPAGTTTYYQPVPGTFVPVPAGVPMGQGTPQFLMTSSGSSSV